MEKIVDVQINKANALITLGSMYRSAADAIKEYVSNALGRMGNCPLRGAWRGAV